VGAAVVDLCWVASGRYDGYFERGLHPWDFAAGALIAREAGATVSGLVDDDFSHGIMAAAPGIATHLHTRLLELDAHMV
jgi:fructose-1,6-bisphosphatase/inositol monophosphatase family enzyme